MRVDLPTYASPITFTTFVEFSITSGTIKSEVVGLLLGIVVRFLSRLIIRKLSLKQDFEKRRVNYSTLSISPANTFNAKS